MNNKDVDENQKTVDAMLVEIPAAIASGNKREIIRCLALYVDAADYRGVRGNNVAIGKALLNGGFKSINNLSGVEKQDLGLCIIGNCVMMVDGGCVPSNVMANFSEKYLNEAVS